MRLNRVSPFICTIPAEGPMSVDGKVYLSETLAKTVDAGAIDQVKNVASLPGIVGESIAMPDMHIGYGFPIGGVAAFDAEHGIISPGGIGFDINCGVRLLKTNLTKQTVQPLIEELLELLNRAIPSGAGRPSSITLSHDELDAILMHGSAWALQHGYAEQEDVATTEDDGCMVDANAAAVSARAKERGINQLGTLGAGNHFLEVQVVENILDTNYAKSFGLSKDQIVIMIHCGSRGLGHQVCTDYLELMEHEYPDTVKNLIEKNLMYAPAASKLGKEYGAAMAAAANFAWCNRQVIAHHVRKAFHRLFPGCAVTQLYDVSHNIAKRETHCVAGETRDVLVHRKGATRAFPDQPVLIPGSMGTASYVLVGTQHAMDQAFGSCCHGAGRSMIRHTALATITAASVRDNLREKGIAIKGVGSKGLVEEAPQAYKDVDEVIRTVAGAGLALPVCRTVPLGVVKG